MAYREDPRWLKNSRDGVRYMGRLLAVYGLLGLVAGAAALLFDGAVRLVSHAVLDPLTGTDPVGGGWQGGARLLLLVVPALGGLGAGLLCARLAPEAMGPGIGAVVDAYLRRRGEMRRRVPLVKALASVITLGSGGSAGVEGPVGQICAGIGGWVGRLFGLSPDERRLLLMAGCAAGIGAVFQAPMAAAIFCAEVLYRQMDIEHEVLVPAIIASTVAHGAFGVIRGWSPLVALPSVDFAHGLQLVAYLVLALVVAVGATGFMALYKAVRRRMRTTTLPLWSRPAMGGLLVGLVGVAVPAALGSGYRIVDLAVAGQVGVGLLLVLAVAKSVTTALTAGSGGSGGLFAPSLVIGGALGGVVGTLAADLAPGLEITPAAFVVVGMAGFFSAVANAPLSTVIMVSELVGSYRLIVPALWVCTLAWLLTRGESLFSEQVDSRLDAPFRLGDMMGAVLHRLRVRDAEPTPAAEVVTVPADMPLRSLVDRFAHSGQAVFPIVDGSGRLGGVVDGRQLRRTLGESGVDTVLIAQDFQSPALVVHPEDTLYVAIGRMTGSGFDDLVVVDRADPHRLVGLLSRRQVINAYHRRMLLQAEGAGEEAVGDVEAVDDTDDIDLGSAIERGGIFTRIDARAPDAIVQALIERAALPAACDRAALLQLLRDREALGSTGVGDGIALPHPHAQALPGIERPWVVMGLLDEPVDWHAYDGQPVDTVCVLLCPSGDVHLRLLGSLARALHDPVLRSMLRERADRKAIIERVRAIGA